ncbi:MAG: amino acid permease [Chlamydiae bacterium]|nr:amino acid permease [Chlamydiota bacterium]
MLPNNKPRRVLSVFILAMMNVSIMLSLRSLPLIAEFGLSSLFYFLIVALFFLVPCALVSAELATGWPKSGGVYVWIREALGDKWGFFGIWMQWVHNVAWYPVILSFVATTIAYVVAPSLINNKFYVISVIIFSFWGMTLLNFLGIKVSSWFSSIGVIAGTIVPGIFIIGLGFSWISGDHPLQITFNAADLIPHFTGVGGFVFMAGLFLAFGGLEVSASLAGEVTNPQKNYPRAILLAALITFALLVLGALSIAVIIPTDKLSLAGGLMEAFQIFLPSFHLEWLLPVLGVLLTIGAIAEVNSWLISPVKGLHATAVHGNLPPFLQNLNKHGTPTHLLFFQAIIVTLTASVFFFMPSISSSFWILTALSAQSYLVMYILMFVSAIRLRYTKPHVPRVYKIPFPHKGIWIASVMGIMSSTFAIIIGFVPPTQLHVGSILFYDSFLVIGLVIMCGIPLVFYKFRKPSWVLRQLPDGEYKKEKK